MVLPCVQYNHCLHNIFRPTSRLTATTGGSLAWNSDANTFATFSSLCELSSTDHDALVLSPRETRPPTGHGLLGGHGPLPPPFLYPPLCCYALQERQKTTFFSLFYISINVGSLLSTILTPFIRSKSILLTLSRLVLTSLFSNYSEYCFKLCVGLFILSGCLSSVISTGLFVYTGGQKSGPF